MKELNTLEIIKKRGRPRKTEVSKQVPKKTKEPKVKTEPKPVIEEAGIYESPSETAEILVPDFLNTDVLVRQDLRRYDMGNGQRWYFIPDPETGEVVEKGIGITSLANLLLPKGAGYDAFLKQQGENADQYRDERAAWGTLLHILKSELTRDRKLNIDTNYILDRASVSMSKNMFEIPQQNQFVRLIQKGLLSFAQFITDTNYEPIGIEVSYLYKGLALTIDDVGYIDYKGQRVVAITDTKSNFNLKGGEKGFYDSHEFQLAGQLRVLRELNPQFKQVDVKTFNWAPKDWKGTKPTYTLKDQSDSLFHSHLFDHYMAVAKMRGYMDKTVTHRKLGGVINLDNFDASDHIRYVVL